MSLVRLESYNNAWYHPGGSFLKRALWMLVAQPLFASAWLSSSLRIRLLRAFGARVGNGVVIKPAVQIKYPWHLELGDHCWIGEHVWIDNLTTVRIGANCCASQGAYFCTGNHDWSDAAFALRIEPISLYDGAWAGAMCRLLPGAVLREGAIAAAGSVITGTVPPYEIFSGNPASFHRRRSLKTTTSDAQIHEVHA